MTQGKPIMATNSIHDNGTSKAVYVIASIVLGSMLICAVIAGAVSAPTSPPPADAKAVVAPVKEPAKAPMSACPMCPAKSGGGEGMGKGMDMTPAMKQHCQMMMNTEMSKDDAACLLAIKQELKLTPEQIQKLEQIVKQSRQEAVALLTPEQQKTLAEVEGQPTSMCVMHTKMHDKMMKKMDDAAPKTTEEKAKK